MRRAGWPTVTASMSCASAPELAATMLRVSWPAYWPTMTCSTSCETVFLPAAATTPWPAPWLGKGALMNSVSVPNAEMNTPGAGSMRQSAA